MAGSFSGPVRVLGDDGILLTTGSASLVTDDEMGGWKGTLETLLGTAVAGKALVVELEISENLLPGVCEIIVDHRCRNKARVDHFEQVIVFQAFRGFLDGDRRLSLCLEPLVERLDGLVIA